MDYGKSVWKKNLYSVRYLDDVSPQMSIIVRNEKYDSVCLVGKTVVYIPLVSVISVRVQIKYQDFEY